MFHEQAAVGQVSQRIVIGQFAYLIFCLAPLGDVIQKVERGWLAMPVKQHPTDLYPAPAPVACLHTDGISQPIGSSAQSQGVVAFYLGLIVGMNQ